jgi:hypothetical protein
MSYFSGFHIKIPNVSFIFSSGTSSVPDVNYNTVGPYTSASFFSSGTSSVPDVNYNTVGPYLFPGKGVRYGNVVTGLGVAPYSALYLEKTEVNNGK